jgi:hypothetical protein
MRGSSPHSLEGGRVLYISLFAVAAIFLFAEAASFLAKWTILDWPEH